LGSAGEDGAAAGVGDQLAIPGQPAGKRALDRLPASAALFELLFGEEDVDSPVGKVDANLVAVSEEADGPAFGGFGRDVADARSGGAAAEAAVGDEGMM